MRFITIGLILFSFCVNAQESIQVDATSFGIDEQKALILTNTDITELNRHYSGLKSEIVLNGSIYRFQSPVQTIQKGIAYRVIYPPSAKQYSLYFSELPLIKMTVKDEISDTPKVSGYFELSHPDHPLVAATIGVEYRGSSSQMHPKKSMEIEFWTDENSREERKLSLLGAREKDSWNLQAMYNEPLRINSVVSNELWLMMHTIYYADKESKAQSGISMQYAELFLNNQYRGVYAIGEKVNRSLLQLKKDKEGMVRGALHKGYSWDGTTFERLTRYNNNSTTWNGFEYKYPKNTVDWSGLYTFLSFVINADDTAFTNNYASVLDLANAVDYFIFMNLVRASDNMGKNIYFARYDADAPFFFVPWDLDGTFGTIWDGSRENITVDILSNGLYKRLWQDSTFRDQLTTRWNTLRKDMLSNASLHNLLGVSYHYLMDNGVYEREALAWSAYHFNESDWNYMNVWLDQRLAFLDIEFNKPLSKEAPTALVVEYFPNPAKDYLIVIHQEIMQAIHITDIRGKLVQKEAPNSFRKLIDLSKLNSGSYFLQIITQNNVHYIKVQKI